MKLLVVSDSHGNMENMVRAVELVQPRMILHLGDCWRDGEALHRLFISRIAAQVETSNPLNRHNSAFCNGPSGVNDRISSAFFSADQVDLRTTLVTTDWLCIVSPGCRIIIFFCAIRTHRKFFHAGALPVIRKGIQDRKSWSTAGTVDKWMQIPPVLWIIHFFLTFFADRNIRRNKDLSLGLFTFNNIKRLKMHVCLCCDILCIDF